MVGKWRVLLLMDVAGKNDVAESGLAEQVNVKRKTDECETDTGIKEKKLKCD